MGREMKALRAGVTSLAKECTEVVKRLGGFDEDFQRIRQSIMDRLMEDETKSELVRMVFFYSFGECPNCDKVIAPPCNTANFRRHSTTCSHCLHTFDVHQAFRIIYQMKPKKNPRRKTNVQANEKSNPTTIKVRTRSVRGNSSNQ